MEFCFAKTPKLKKQPLAAFLVPYAYRRLPIGMD
jgi:hypothetical protein